MQVVIASDNVMILLLCQRTSSLSSQSDLCPADSGTVKVYGRRGIELDHDQLSRLMLHVRLATLTCIQTTHVETLALNGLYQYRVVRFHDSVQCYYHATHC